MLDCDDGALDAGLCKNIILDLCGQSLWQASLLKAKPSTKKGHRAIYAFYRSHIDISVTTPVPFSPLI